VELRLIPVGADVVLPARLPGGLVDCVERSGARPDVDVVADDRRRGEDSPAGIEAPQDCGEKEREHRQLAFFFFGFPIFAISGLPIHRPYDKHRVQVKV